ncbi:MAG: YabP/YqfC family sporulation protein [Clostridia bacterium]|nr:YabP/YqfC family sporulation protein [Clostridia bacterium]
MAKKLKIEKSKAKNKWNLNPLTDVFDKDLLNGPYIEICGNGKIEIDGCEGVYEYNSDYLKLRLKKGAIIICGSDFDILTFENRLITVRGKISTIEFSN